MLYNNYTGNILKVHIITEDASLRRELESVLPGEHILSADLSGLKNAVIFFDLDSLKAGPIREISRSNFVIGITKQRRTDVIMEASAMGAYEMLIRPLRADSLLQLIEELNAYRQELSETLSVEHPPSSVSTCAIVGYSPAIMDVCKKLARLSQVDVPVLITGETGTGKELIAEAIAQLSSRFGKPFVVINCAAVPETLLESELFGFEKGSFTGALSAKEGMLKIADEGSVFFDEVGELPLSLQGKLLRFLQTQSFYPIGSTKEVQVNVRVISATNRDLSSMVREGKFRADLYHRLRVGTIHLPPLHKRKNDILPLVQFFINRYRQTVQREIRGITKVFLKKLTDYNWPGNIRELENTVRSAIAFSKTPYLTSFELKELGDQGLPRKRSDRYEMLASAVIGFVKEAVEKKEKNIYEMIHREVDKPLIDYILSSTKENQSEAARILGISRLTLRKKIS